MTRYLFVSGQFPDFLLQQSAFISTMASKGGDRNVKGHEAQDASTRGRSVSVGEKLVSMAMAATSSTARMTEQLSQHERLLKALMEPSKFPDLSTKEARQEWASKMMAGDKDKK